MLKPEKLLPYYRHGSQTPWGGTRLKSLYGRDIPDETTGESLEVSAIPGMNCTLEDGTAFADYLARWGDKAAGTGVKGPFPLLIKILDARDTLSVQVHPDDAYAARYGGMGKTEAWYILAADEGAQLVYGLKDVASRDDLVRLSGTGALRDHLRRVTVRPGEVYFIPSGTVHAIGRGIVLYEIQQSSDITYRLYDWDRKDAQGRSRPLHVQQAADVADLDFSGVAVAPRRLSGTREQLLRERFFSLQRIHDARGEELPPEPERFRLLTALKRTVLTCAGSRMELAPGETVFLPADMGPAALDTDECLLAYPTLEDL